MSEEDPYIVLDTNIWIGFCVGRERETRAYQEAKKEFIFAFSEETISELKSILKAITYPDQQKAK